MPGRFDRSENSSCTQKGRWSPRGRKNGYHGTRACTRQQVGKQGRDQCQREDRRQPKMGMEKWRAGCQNWGPGASSAAGSPTRRSADVGFKNHLQGPGNVPGPACMPPRCEATGCENRLDWMQADC